MSETTRNYINQWIIKSNNAIEKAVYNLDRIHQAVISKGEYFEIVDNINVIMFHLVKGKLILPHLQSLFNDPRANRIEAT